MYQAIISLQFHACLRIGELVISKNPEHVIKKKQIKMHKKNLKIKFVSYKHSRNSKPKIVVAKNPDETICPVKLTKRYHSIRPKTSKYDPYFISNRSKPLYRTDIAKVLKDSIVNIGLNPKNYNTHSLRSGKATELYIKQCPEPILKSFGRWRSDAHRNYIKPDVINIPKQFRYNMQ